MSDIGKTLRLKSVFPPCLMDVSGAGKIIDESAKAWWTQNSRGVITRITKRRALFHIEPCSKCSDYPKEST